jgi:hypothetical protein
MKNAVFWDIMPCGSTWRYIPEVIIFNYVIMIIFSVGYASVKVEKSTVFWKANFSNQLRLLWKLLTKR